MIKKLSILAILALLLAACGTTTQQTDDGNTASNQATAVEALEVNEQPTQSGGADIEYEVEDDLGEELGIPFDFMPTDNGFMSVFESPASQWDCSESSVTGDATDADDDGIARNATYTINCTKSFTQMPVIGDVVTVERTGTLTMQDADDDDPNSGYTSSGDITYSYLNDTFSVEHKFDRSWQKSGENYSYSHSNAWIWSAGDSSHTVKHAHTGTYIPDSAGDPFAAGQLSESATVKHYLNDTLELTVTEEVNLHLNKSCDPAADDGTIEFTVNNVSKTVEFTGCGEYEVQTP
ncbi:hypothetical protein [Oceanithermus sp.]